MTFTQPQLFSQVMLLSWPMFCVLLFLWLPKHRAAICGYLLGVLLLPPAQTLLIPVLPDLTRKTMPALGILFAGIFLNRLPWRGERVDGASRLFLGLILLTNIVRVMTNRFPLHYGPTTVPPLVAQNAITFILHDMLVFFVPFYLGVSLGRDRDRVRELLVCWVALALVYMLLVAFEIRMSPQINMLVYGYFQHSWEQMKRDGGFRSIVFLEHGLEVALFTALSLLMALVAGRAGYRVLGLLGSRWVILFFPILVLCKSFAAVFYGILGLILAMWGTARIRMRCAVSVAFIVLTLPLTRVLDWFPTADIVEFIEGFSPDRASSLAFRYRNEDTFLEKAKERPWTGWGGFLRYWVFDEYGRSSSVPDGSWIVLFSTGGVFRFLGVFGLLLWPIVLAWRRLPKLASKEDQQVLSLLALTSAFATLDLVPNSFFNYLAPLLAGAVLGMCLGSRHPPTAA